MSVKIVYQDIAVGAQEDATVTTTPAQAGSRPADLPAGVDPVPIATLELNHWLLGGDRQLKRSQPIGFWSSQLSGADGTFPTPPSITVDFDQQYTSLGILLQFDPSTGDYCSAVTISWYQGATLLAEQRFSPDGPGYFCERTVSAYNRVVIKLDATSLPYRRARLTRIMFGIIRTFLRDELRQVKVTEQVDLISSVAAVNTLDFTLDSHDDVEFMFQLRQPVYAYDGETLVGVFYIDSSSRKGERLYDLSCVDAIGVLDEDVMPAAVYEAKPLRALLEEVLDGKFLLELDPELEKETVSGYLPDCSRRKALHQIVFAARAIVDTSGSEAVRVSRLKDTAAETIPPSRIYDGGSVETSAVVTAVSVTAHSYSKTGGGNDTVEIGGETWYHTTAVTTIKNPNVTASDKQNVKEFKDATLVNPGNVAAVAQAVYDHYMRRSRQRVKIVMAGEQPGSHVTASTPWGTAVTGHIASMSITLSGIAAADCEVVGI